MEPDPFSSDYGDARERFLAAATRASAQLSRYRHPDSGPMGEDVSTDVAWIGPADARNVLVLLSGTHGVEGFCGSGAQIDWLQREEYRRLNAVSAVMLIHAVNPWGFAWLRRSTHENIDLNRNWMNFPGPLPTNDGYAQLHEHIVPRVWDEASLMAADAAFEAYAAAHGQAALQHAVTAGQHEFPDGLFFGGLAPSWSRTTQTAIFESHLRPAEQVTIIDYHTGLGPQGYAEPICFHATGSSQLATARATFGATLASIAEGQSASSRVAGDGLTAAEALLSAQAVTAIALEFGTLPLPDVLRRLRADAWLHAYDDPRSAAAKAIKRGIRDAFYVDDDRWRGMVLGQSMQYCRMAMAAFRN